MASRTVGSIGGLLACVLSTFVGARSASAQTRLDFTLDNETGLAIVSVLLRPSHTHDGVPHEWSNDALGVDVLDDGGQVHIQFSITAQIEGRRWDLLVYDRAGNVHVWNNIDLGTTSHVTLFYNADTGRTWAVTQ